MPQAPPMLFMRCPVVVALTLLLLLLPLLLWLALGLWARGMATVTRPARIAQVAAT